MSADQGGTGGTDKRFTGPTRAQGRSQGRSQARPPLAVLFVDADPRRPEALSRALPPDSAVAIVSSIQAAIGAIAQRVPDLVVTDLDLPDGSGLQLIARIHQNPATRHALLMVVTSRAMLGDKIAALEAGVDDYLVRPVDPERFALHVQLVSRFRRTLQR